VGFAAPGCPPNHRLSTVSPDLSPGMFQAIRSPVNSPSGGYPVMHTSTDSRPPTPHRNRSDVLAAATHPDPFALADLCARLGRLRRRPIVLLPVFGRLPQTTCQPWFAADHGDYVLAEQHTTAVHRELLTLHTVAHLLLAHPGRPVDGHALIADRMPALDWQRLRPLLGPAYIAEPHTPPHTEARAGAHIEANAGAHVQTHLGADVGASVEAAADDLAVQILQRAGRLPRIIRQPWPAHPLAAAGTPTATASTRTAAT